MDRDILDSGIKTGDGIPLKDEHPSKDTPEYREYRKKWDMATRREILTDFPLHVDIELTNACNLKCSMCWQSGALKYPKGLMSMDLFRKIIDEGVPNGLKAIKLQSRGESMMHPNIIDAIRYAKAAGVLDVQLTTNATLLKPEQFDTMLNSGLDVLIFSIDICHKESYEQLHPGKKYEDVIENIMAIMKRKLKLGLKYPFIRIQAVKWHGADLHSFIQATLDRMISLADRVEIGEEFRLVDNSQPLDKSKFELLPCPYLWQRMVVNYDGKITVCCRDYNCEHIMGDITKNSIKEIWNGLIYSRFRELHENMLRDKIKLCAHCDLYIKPLVQPNLNI